MPIIDSQVHIYAKDSPDFPWADDAALVLEHARNAGIALADAVTGEDLIAQMDRVGVDGALLVNFGGLYQFDNSYALDVAARFPDRFAMVGRLDPLSPTLEQDVADFAGRPGTVGVRVLGYMGYREAFLAGAFDPMFRAAQANNLALCIYAPESVRELHELAGRYPELQIVLDHMCLRQSPPYTLDDDPFADLTAVLELAQHPNIAAKLSGMATLSATPFPFDDVWPAIHRIVRAFGAQRVMWGTDTTRTRLAYADELEFIRRSNELSDDDKALVLGGAVERIFKWSPGRRGPPAAA